MTPVARWVKRFAEKWLGEFYEGEEPPDRIGEQVVMFANLRPFATRGEWIEFAKSFAEETYRAGYLRGVEHTERDAQEIEDGHTPEQLADDIDPNWRWRPMGTVQLHDPNEIVRGVRPEHEVIEDHLEMAKRQARKDRRF